MSALLNVRPTNAADIYPISICNTIYKIVTRVLVERLTKILPTIISEKQGAFLIDLEIIHQIVKPTKSKTQLQNIDLKIELSIAFDKIEWSYLILILKNSTFLFTSFIGA